MFKTDQKLFKRGKKTKTFVQQTSDFNLTLLHRTSGTAPVEGVKDQVKE